MILASGFLGTGLSLGELAVVILALIGGAVLLFGAFIGITDWWEERGYGEDWETEREKERAQELISGIVTCDFSDDDQLKSFQNQLELSAPNQIEQSESDSTSGGGSAGTGSAKLNVSKEKTKGRKETFNPEWDPNVAAKRVVIGLSERDELNRNLDTVRAGSIDQELAGKIDRFQDGRPPEEVKVIQGLREVLIDDASQRLKVSFAKAISSARPVLIEADWTVEPGGSMTKLVLKNLRTPRFDEYDYGYNEGPNDPVPVPDGVRIATEVPDEALTSTGKARIKVGTTVRAAVLGIPVAGQNELHIGITPVAIYQRTRPN